MTDLYETLGVERTASAADVKAAYRRRARKAHPDTGGSSEAMTALTVAYATLGDADKRAEYDATGKYGSTIDQARGEALDLINQIYNQIIEKPNALQIDIVGETVRHITGMRGQANAHVAKLEGMIVAFGKMKKRVKTRKGPNVLGGLLDQRIQMAGQGLAATRRDIERIGLALDILKDEKFEPEPRTSTTSVFWSTASAGTATT